MSSLPQETQKSATACDISEATTSYLIVAEHQLWQCSREKTEWTAPSYFCSSQDSQGSSCGGQYQKRRRGDGES